MFLGANEVLAGQTSNEPSVQEHAEYYLKFKDAPPVKVKEFVASTSGKTNSAIIEMARAFELEKKEAPKPKPKLKEEENGVHDK